MRKVFILLLLFIASSVLAATHTYTLVSKCSEIWDSDNSTWTDRTEWKHTSGTFFWDSTKKIVVIYDDTHDMDQRTLHCEDWEVQPLYDGSRSYLLDCYGAIFDYSIRINKWDDGDLVIYVDYLWIREIYKCVPWR